jgi:hypothetical protein
MRPAGNTSAEGLLGFGVIDYDERQAGTSRLLYGLRFSSEETNELASP